MSETFWIALAIFIALIPVGFFSYCFVRGGWWGDVIYDGNPPFKFSFADEFNAALFGFLFWGLSGVSWYFGILAALAMWAGATPGWHDYIVAMTGEDQTHSKTWGMERMTERGAFLGSCLALVPLICAVFFQLTGYPLNYDAFLPQAGIYALWCVLWGFAMGPVYFLCIRFIKPLWKFNFWSCSELIYSMGLFPPLAILYDGRVNKAILFGLHWLKTTI